MRTTLAAATIACYSSTLRKIMQVCSLYGESHVKYYSLPRNDSPYQRALVNLEAVFFVSTTKTELALSASFRDRHASAAEFSPVVTALLPGRALKASSPIAPGTVDNWTTVHIVPFARTRLANHI